MLFSAYPNAKVGERTTALYEAMLADLDVKVARAAAQRLIATSKFLPTISEIREACADQRHGAPRSGEEAYAELMRSVRRHGRNYGQGEPRFADPNISRAIAVWGSWNDLCASPVDDPGGRARFIELYEALSGRVRQDLVAGASLPMPARVQELPQ